MYTELQSYLKRPELYERTAEKFWTDPHIAAQMLIAHLDPSHDGASRRPDFIERAVEWIASLIPNGARLLDIGCGPGLYTRRFAERGLRVTGLDFSENSIAYARAHDPDSEYVVQDYLQMEFDGEFDIITLIWCDYGALIPAERADLLVRIQRALKPGGLFLFDVFTPLYYKGKHDSARWEVNPDGGFMSAKPHVALYRDSYYGDTVAGGRTVIIEEDAVHCYNLWNCCFTRQTLLEEAGPLGFAEAGIYSDAAGTPYVEDSELICAVFRKI